MCVPYSFCIDSRGKIYDGENLDHHTDICARHGLEYDRVLKPEYQIWNRELKDLDFNRFSIGSRQQGNTLMMMELSLLKDPFTDADGIVKDRFQKIAYGHVEKNFKDWKAGLRYIEQNWAICKKYVPKLALSLHEIPNTLGNKTLEAFQTELAKDFRRYVAITDYGNCDIVYRRARLTFTAPDWTNDTVTRDIMIGAHELVSAREIAEDTKFADAPVVHSSVDLMKLRVNDIVAYHIDCLYYEVMRAIHEKRITLSVDGDLLYSDFEKHWSKKDNRVLCWQE